MIAGLGGLGCYYESQTLPPRLCEWQVAGGVRKPSGICVSGTTKVEETRGCCCLAVCLLCPAQGISTLSAESPKHVFVSQGRTLIPITTTLTGLSIASTPAAQSDAPSPLQWHNDALNQVLERIHNTGTLILRPCRRPMKHRGGPLQPRHAPRQPPAASI